MADSSGSAEGGSRPPGPDAGTAPVEPAPLEHRDHRAVVARIAATADADPDALRPLWEELVSEWGTAVASRLWQEGLASSDVGQT
jgi:hypothetical protein